MLFWMSVFCLYFHCMVPMERLELSQDCSYTLLKRTRLPFRHIGKPQITKDRAPSVAILPRIAT